MGRTKRYVSRAGELFCTVCQKWVHLRYYRTAKLLGDGLDNIDAIWWTDPANGRDYGKPDGYCRKCASKMTQGKDAVRKYQEELGLDKTSWRDRFDAEQDKMDEEALVKWKEPDPSFLAREAARLEALYGDGR